MGDPTAAAPAFRITRNTIVPDLVGAPGWQQDAEPTPQQAKIIQLLKNHSMP